MTRSWYAGSPPGLPNEANALRDGPQPKAVLGQKGFRRKAWGLLVFGLVVAVVCTRATLTAVQQEAAVVQLAQELAASEAAVSVCCIVEHCTADNNCCTCNFIKLPALGPVL